MESNSICQAWSLAGQRYHSVHWSKGNLATISNDLNSDFSVQVIQNGKTRLRVDPGNCKTLSTLPGDQLEVHADLKRCDSQSASGQVLF